MDDRARLIAFLVRHRRSHVPDLSAEEEEACAGLVDTYLAAGRLSDAEVLQVAALPVGARIRAVQDRYGPIWVVASADQRRRRRALGWTPPAG